MRRHLITAVVCGLLITGCTIASAVVLAHIVARVITDPTARTIGQWVWPLSMLLALWTIRTVGHWLQARLGQRSQRGLFGVRRAQEDLTGRLLRNPTGW